MKHLTVLLILISFVIGQTCICDTQHPDCCNLTEEHNENVKILIQEISWLKPLCSCIDDCIFFKLDVVKDFFIDEWLLPFIDCLLTTIKFIYMLISMLFAVIFSFIFYFIQISKISGIFLICFVTILSGIWYINAK